MPDPSASVASLHVLPGIERRDLVGQPTPCEEIFKGALAAGLTTVVIVGLDRAGELYVASSDVDVDRDVGRLMRAVTWLTSHQVVEEPGSA